MKMPYKINAEKKTKMYGCLWNIKIEIYTTTAATSIRRMPLPSTLPLPPPLSLPPILTPSKSSHKNHGKWDEIKISVHTEWKEFLKEGERANERKNKISNKKEHNKSKVGSAIAAAVVAMTLAVANIHKASGERESSLKPLQRNFSRSNFSHFFIILLETRMAPW